MAHFKSSPNDFIQQAFPPMIAVMHSPGVEDICRKNNLNFIQLIKPFSKMTAEGSLKDPSSGGQIPIRNLKVAFCDINARPPPPPVARSYFNSSISSNISDKTIEIPLGEGSIDVPVSCPWFDAWRDTFLQVQYPSEHEFTKHFIACLIVVSSNDHNPLQKIEELLDSLQTVMTPGPSKLPKWFGPNTCVITTYLYLHDESQSIFDFSVIETMKWTYGGNVCFKLLINSQKLGDHVTPSPDPWAQYISSCIEYKDEGRDQEVVQGIETAQEAGERSSPSTPVIVHPLSPVGEGSLPSAQEHFAGINAFRDQTNVTPQHGKLLSADDLENIKQFINDFCLKALIPHFEQLIHNLGDQISNKKGVSRSLFSATKRWFGSNKPGAPGNHIPPTAIAYSSDSHELQLRKLGDLCFMIGHYNLAFTAYHSAKRDFGADGAWLHYAGALEMAALAAFMSNSESLSRKVIEYAEESIVTYLNPCRMNQFATRATLLSVECLKGRGLFGEAAKQLIRMSGEDSDLRSAVLLEQAAYCFLSSARPIMHRKYAFHMVLAGHRFSKASHRNHSMRCYYQAYQVYSNKSWSVAEDHILYTIGKHASNLKSSSNAVEAFSLLVTRSSRQSAQPQELYLKDYISTIEQAQNSGDGVILSLPLIDFNLIQVLLSVPAPTLSVDRIPASDITFHPSSCLTKHSEDTIWWKLEEKMVNFAQGSSSVLLFKPTVQLLSKLTNNTSPGIGFVGERIGVCVCLQNPLNIQINLRDIALVWTVYPDLSEDNQSSIGAASKSVAEITLPPDSMKYIMLMVIPRVVGDLQITGLSYTLHDPASDTKVLGGQPFVQSTKNKLDKKLYISVVKKVPHLEITFYGLKKELLSGEILPVIIRIKNTGNTPTTKILLVSSDNFSVSLESRSQSTIESIIKIPLEQPLDVMNSVEEVLLFQPKFNGGTKNLELLIYYECGLESSKPRYRIVRHSWPTVVHTSLHISSLCSPSQYSFSQCDEAVNIQFVIKSNVFESQESMKINGMHVDGILLASSMWKLSQDVNIPTGVNIKKGESVFMLGQSLKTENEPRKSNFSSVQFTQCLPRWDLCFVPKMKESIEKQGLQMTCAFSWEAEVVSSDDVARNIYGQDYVSILPSGYENSENNTLKIFDETTLEHQKEENQKIICMKIKYPQNLTCSQPFSRLLVIPVTLWLKNRSEKTVSVKVTAIPMPQSSAEENNISDRFVWMGKTTHFEDLNAKSTKQFSLLVGITGSGAFDLASRLKIEAMVSNHYVFQTLMPQAVLIVAHA